MIVSILALISSTEFITDYLMIKSN